MSSSDEKHKAARRRPVAHGPGGGLPALMAGLVGPLARDAADPLRRIRLAWGLICGMPLARHIEPLRLEGRTLHVGARGPIWRDAVYLQRAALLKHVRRYAAQVERIWLHSLPEHALPGSQAAASPTLSERTAGISDVELRLAFERLLGARDRRSGSDA